MRGKQECGTKPISWILWGRFVAPKSQCCSSPHDPQPVEPMDPVAFFLTFATTMTSLHASALASELKHL